MQAKFFAIFLSILIVLFVVDLIRRRKMTFKYSLGWFFSSLTVLLLAVNDHLLLNFSKWVGFTLLSNFIFFLAMVFFIFLSLMLTIYVNEENNRSETLAQSLGILELEIKRLRSEFENIHKS